MKKIWIIFLLPMFSSSAFGQVNLVPNPSFEDTVNCPSAPTQIFNSTGWSSYSITPDYYNSCAIGTGVCVPDNWGGYQQASSGNAYAGLANYISPYAGGNNTREYIGRLLSAPLLIGTKYFVSLKVSLSISSPLQVNCATSKIGVMFSTVPYSISNPAPITNNPPVYSSSIITDSLNWITVSGSIIADSAYQYIILGNFFDDNNTDSLIMTTDIFCTSYYFIDDICVSTDSLTCKGNFLGEEEHKKNSFIEIFPNPVSNALHIKNVNDKASYVIVNWLGQIKTQGELNEKENIIDISSLSNGVYFLSIDKNYFFKILLNH